MRKQVEDWARAQLDARAATHLVFSGHSLGGALAILAAHHFAGHRDFGEHLVGAVVTFGSPMVGTDKFSEEYDDKFDLKNRTIRLAATLDLVVVAQAITSGYRHVGRPWHIKLRPAFSRWRMYFFSPLWGPEEEAEHKAKNQQASSSTTQTSGDWNLKNLLIRWALKALWFLVKLARRAVAAHSLNRNYALYLSVLSYQGLRKHYGDNFDQAHARLGDHLAYVRGRNGRLFGVARDGPIKVKSESDQNDLKRRFKHFIV